MPFNVVSLRRAHEHILALSARAIDEELAKTQQVATEHVIGYAKFKRRSRKLEQGTRARVVRAGGGRRVIVFNRVKYAAAIDQGAKPHVIRPRRAKLLAFHLGGRLVFARQVNHPGNRAYRFLYRATQAAARIARQNIEARLARIAGDRH